MDFRTLALCAGVLCLGAAAQADAIDGDWCAPDGFQRLHIEGPRIVIPSGQEMTGSYGRHQFAYVVPEGEPDAGMQVFIQQLSEHDVDIYRDSAEPERWHRCQAVVS